MRLHWYWHDDSSCVVLVFTYRHKLNQTMDITTDEYLCMPRFIRNLEASTGQGESEYCAYLVHMCGLSSILASPKFHCFTIAFGAILIVTVSL
jgi:hypothetical protein